MADGQPRILFEPGRVRVGVRGVGGIKVGGGKGPPTGGPGPPGVGPGGHGRGRGGGNSLGHLVSAFGAIAAATSKGVPSPPDVAALTLISTNTLAAPGTFNVTGIAQTYSDLIIVLIARGTRAATSDTLVITFNADTGANYEHEYLQGDTGVVSAAVTAAAAAIEVHHLMPAATSLASSFGMAETVVGGYTSAAFFKPVISTEWGDYNGASGRQTAIIGGLWKSTAAVTSVQAQGGVTANLATGSQMRVYGRS